MVFIVAVLLFVVVVGIVDAGLPWPDPRKRSRDRGTLRSCGCRKVARATGAVASQPSLEASQQFGGDGARDSCLGL
jgi:hypothetical protein